MEPSHWRMMGTSKITNLLGQLLATVMSEGFLARLGCVKLYLGGLLCTADRGSCGCSLEPEGSGSSPTLEDYKKGDTKACSITAVLQHPYVERLSTKIVIQGPLCPSFLVVPEQESTEAEPNNNDGLDLWLWSVSQGSISPPREDGEQSSILNSAHR
ncbi:hypothetical protein V502_05003 [Pseudogymnoascus sp. VKM F-4520 (FW-2644)]|nr:hypothetical protein V502_05003 [Pseudogymnoascus sp. VKM F-4520 (FW-2644)]